MLNASIVFIRVSTQGPGVINVVTAPYSLVQRKDIMLARAFNVLSCFGKFSVYGMRNARNAVAKIKEIFPIVSSLNTIESI